MHTQATVISLKRISPLRWMLNVEAYQFNWNLFVIFMIINALLSDIQNPKSKSIWDNVVVALICISGEFKWISAFDHMRNIQNSTLKRNCFTENLFSSKHFLVTIIQRMFHSYQLLWLCSFILEWILLYFPISFTLHFPFFFGEMLSTQNGQILFRLSIDSIFDICNMHIMIRVQRRGPKWMWQSQRKGNVQVFGNIKCISVQPSVKWLRLHENND